MTAGEHDRQPQPFQCGVCESAWETGEQAAICCGNSRSRGESGQTAPAANEVRARWVSGRVYVTLGGVEHGMTEEDALSLSRGLAWCVTGKDASDAR